MHHKFESSNKLRNAADTPKKGKRPVPLMHAKQLEIRNRLLRDEIKLAKKIIDAQQSFLAVTTKHFNDPIQWMDEVKQIARKLGDFVGVPTACDALQISQDEFSALCNISACEM